MSTQLPTAEDGMSTMTSIRPRCGCGTLLRLGNRTVGKCDTCQRKDQVEVVYYSPKPVYQAKRIPKKQPDPCQECGGPVVGHKGKRFCTPICKKRNEAAAYRAKKFM